MYDEGFWRSPTIHIGRSERSPPPRRSRLSDRSSPAPPAPRRSARSPLGAISGSIGVGGLVVGCMLMVRETRFAIRNLGYESELAGIMPPLKSLAVSHSRKKTGSFPRRAAV